MDVTMPQLGETVTEGTITRWFKQVGESVAVDEPLFEVSTDKVDSEVPAPVAGVLSEVLVAEGETVVVGTRLAVIGGAGPSTGPSTSAVSDAGVGAGSPPPLAALAPPGALAAGATGAEIATPEGTGAQPAPVRRSSPPIPASPLVRRLISEYGLDAETIAGTGDGGRITRNDVLAAARARGAGAPAASPAATGAPAPAVPASQPSAPESLNAGADAPDLVIPFDNIRRRTAEHMVRSKATSPHVYTSVEVDFEGVERARRTGGAEWKAAEGFALTYLPFICRAFSDVIHDYPNVNASVDGDSLVVHRAVNLGIAVDLDFRGLVAPVVRGVDGKRLRAIAREIRDLAARAKSKQLGPDEIVGGTFTITNMGPFGTALTLPIINQPQVAILACDGIQKKPVVVSGPDGDDAIAVHHVGVLALAWDHRAFDGAYAASFLRDVKVVIETRDWEAELA
jgi:pyruvate dehydrogenase E2 component (dihydrolipoamide acetyltransferase)